MNISLAAEPVFNFFGINISNSLLTSFLVSLILIIFCLNFSKIKLQLCPKGKSLQNFLEIIIEVLYSLFETAAGEKIKKFFPLAASFFVFILFDNWVGLLPGVGTIGLWEKHNSEKILIPIFRAGTADLNTTIALAIISVIAIQYFGLKSLGVKYFSKFINFKNPINFYVGILEIISEFAKIMSFAFRLFGNIFAGEVLLTVMAGLMPIIIPLPFLGLEIFVGFIQALVFVMLSLVFYRVAVSHH